MNENHSDPTPAADPTRPEPPASPEPPAAPEVSTPPAPPYAAAPTARARWRDRVFGFRSMVAVAIAGVVLGAGAGAVTALVADGDDGPGLRHELMRGPGWEGREGRNGPPPGFPQQVPPGTAPQQEESTSPEDGSSPNTSGS